MNEQLRRELEEHDADILVGLLGITSAELIAAFPVKVEEYANAIIDADIDPPWDEDDDEAADEWYDPDDLVDRIVDRDFRDVEDDWK